MNANQTLLQMKYARVVSLFASKTQIPMAKALDFFYHSTEYQMMREGVGDLHCMTEEDLVEDLIRDWKGEGRYSPP